MHAPGVSGHFLQKMIKMMILESLLQNMRSYFQYAKFFSLGFSGQESASNAGDLVSIPGLGRSPGGGHGNPLQYSCLETPMDREAWWASSWGCKESDPTERLTLSLSSETDVVDWICFCRENYFKNKGESESRSVVSNSFRPHGLLRP